VSGLVVGACECGVERGNVFGDGLVSPPLVDRADDRAGLFAEEGEGGARVGLLVGLAFELAGDELSRAHRRPEVAELGDELAGAVGGDVAGTGGVADAEADTDRVVGRPHLGHEMRLGLCVDLRAEVALQPLQCVQEVACLLELVERRKHGLVFADRELDTCGAAGLHRRLDPHCNRGVRVLAADLFDEAASVARRDTRDWDLRLHRELDHLYVVAAKRLARQDVGLVLDGLDVNDAPVTVWSREAVTEVVRPAAAEPASRFSDRISETQRVRDRRGVEGADERVADSLHASTVCEVASPVKVVEGAKHGVRLRVGEVVRVRIVRALEAVRGSGGVVKGVGSRREAELGDEQVRLVAFEVEDRVWDEDLAVGDAENPRSGETRRSGPLESLALPCGCSLAPPSLGRSCPAMSRASLSLAAPHVNASLRDTSSPRHKTPSTTAVRPARMRACDRVSDRQSSAPVTFAPALGLVLTHRSGGLVQEEAAMLLVPARVPSPSDVDELANHLARAISMLDEIKPGDRSLEAAFVDEVILGEEPKHLTAAETGVMFLAAQEALDAADVIRGYGEQIIAALPSLAGRDDGGTYASRFANQPHLELVTTAEEASD
jgi:hypothetical protein